MLLAVVGMEQVCSSKKHVTGTYKRGEGWHGPGRSGDDACEALCLALHLVELWEAAPST